MQSKNELGRGVIFNVGSSGVFNTFTHFNNNGIVSWRNKIQKLFFYYLRVPKYSEVVISMIYNIGWEAIFG